MEEDTAAPKMGLPRRTRAVLSAKGTADFEADTRSSLHDRDVVQTGRTFGQRLRRLTRNSGHLRFKNKTVGRRNVCRRPLVVTAGFFSFFPLFSPFLFVE